MISKIISNHLKKHIPLPKSHVANSYSLKEKISKVRIPKEHVLVSFDVISLFTNIQYDLVIKAIKNRKKYLRWKKIPFKKLKSAISFLLNNTYFQFNNEFYKQIFGTSMDSSVSSKFSPSITHCRQTPGGVKSAVTVRRSQNIRRAA